MLNQLSGRCRQDRGPVKNCEAVRSAAHMGVGVKNAHAASLQPCSAFLVGRMHTKSLFDAGCRRDGRLQTEAFVEDSKRERVADACGPLAQAVEGEGCSKKGIRVGKWVRLEWCARCDSH